MRDMKDKNSKNKILFSETDIKDIVCRVADEISQDCKSMGINSLNVICVLKGAFVFAADLVRQLEIPNINIEFISASSYGSSDVSSGNVKLGCIDNLSIFGENILIVEDIIDTGNTLKKLTEQIKSFEPNTVRVCAMFDKPDRRSVDFDADYVGSVIPDEFIVGYGLDYAEMYRDLPYVTVLK